MPNTGSANGGPWWSRLSIAALALVSFVYLAETIGGTYLDLLQADLIEQRRVSKDISAALTREAKEAELRNKLLAQQIEEARESNRIQRRILEVQMSRGSQ